MGASELDGFKPSGFSGGDFTGVVAAVVAGVGELAGSAFSVGFALGVGVGDAPFFFGVGDLSGFGVGLFLDFAFDFGVGDLVEAGVGLPFFAGVFVASGVAVASGVGDSSSSPGLFSALGDLVA